MRTLDSRQEAKLNMYDVVRTHCNGNSAIIETNAAFTTAFDEFKTKVAAIESAARISGANLTGIAADKSVSKQDLSRIASQTAGLIYAYAAKNGNNTLKQAVNFSASDLLRLKDAEIAPQSQSIHDKGVENLAALADYGVTAEKLADLQAAINSYAQSVPKPRTAIAERSTVKANIKQLFREADTILVEQLDRLIENFRKDHPDFVSTYKAARKIVDPKSKSKPEGETEGNNPPA